ncbi:MAG TPA: hypothetical protein PLM56_17525 [Cyclobacteriaceae bacterium]|nr:hypothetical protein [Cyclobacteriaceae bacterium]HRF35310.1 hypothetical protein [Cyclobacteriaceae bacterium]
MTKLLEGLRNEVLILVVLVSVTTELKSQEIGKQFKRHKTSTEFISEVDSLLVNELIDSNQFKLGLTIKYYSLSGSGVVTGSSLRSIQYGVIFMNSDSVITYSNSLSRRNQNPYVLDSKALRISDLSRTSRATLKSERKKVKSILKLRGFISQRVVIESKAYTSRSNVQMIVAYFQGKEYFGFVKYGVLDFDVKFLEKHQLKGFKNILEFVESVN